VSAPVADIEAARADDRPAGDGANEGGNITIIKLIAAAAVAGSIVGLPAHAAGLTGDTVTCAGDARITCSPVSTTVGGRVEFGTNRFLNVNFTDTGLTISNGFFGQNSFSGGPADFILRFSDLTKRFDTATLGASSGASGFSARNFSLNAPGVLTVGIGGTVFDGYGSVSINLTTAAPVVVSPTSAAVPEPAAWATMLAGLALTGGALRGRRQRAGLARAA